MNTCARLLRLADEAEAAMTDPAGAHGIPHEQNQIPTNRGSCAPYFLSVETT